MSKLIQFFHPGSESKPNPGDFYRGWNTPNHTRSFLTAPGTCVSSTDSRAPVDAQLLFWGEWEGPATVRPIKANQNSTAKSFPNYMFIPHSERYPETVEFENGCNNTDPFVFGSEFIYCWCMQESKPTLRQLERGDVILFGSQSGGDFVLDTVFVVSSFLEYAHPDELLKHIPDQPRVSAPLEFIEASIRPIKRKPNDEDKKFRLYRGATFDNPVNGMFSYAPAMQASIASLGFARPTLTLPPNLFNDKQNQGINITSDSVTISDEEKINEFNLTEDAMQSVQSLWQQVTNEVLSQGLQLGVRFQLPSAQLFFSKT
jgi:hypothetical protein